MIVPVRALDPSRPLPVSYGVLRLAWATWGPRMTGSLADNSGHYRPVVYPVHRAYSPTDGKWLRLS